MNDTATDSLAHTADTPDIDALLEEYNRAWTQNPSWLADLAIAEDIRYTRWAGQSSDGLKHQEILPEGQRAKPYDLAPDCRVPLADETINALVDLEYAAFWSARINVKPNHVSRLTAQQMAEWRAIVSWIIHGPLKESLIDTVEFAAQLTWSIGHCFLHPAWRKANGLRLQSLKLDQILQLAQTAPEDSILQTVPALVMDPEMEQVAVELFQQLYPHISVKRARQVVRDLRNEGEAYFPVPEVVENRPELSVLIPGIDLLAPVEMTDVQKSRIWFLRCFMVEADLLAMKNTPDEEERWSPEFVDACIEFTKGDVSDGSAAQTRQDTNSQNIEIIHAYVRGVDDDGVPGIYCTVLSPHLAKIPAHRRQGEGGQLFGKHYLCDYAHGQYPLVVKRSEVVGRRPEDARGVPEVLATQQLQLKRQRDACAIYAELNTTPPLKKKGQRASKLPPELGPLGIINVTQSDEWEKLDLAGEPKVAMMIEDKVRAESKEYYGIPLLDAPLSAGQQRRQRFVNRSLMTWGVALWQLSVLTYQNLSPAELEELLGRAPLLSADLLKKHQLALWFDVRAMDNDWVKELVGQIIQLLSVDTGGVVDRSKLMGILLSYLDPTLADEVTMDKAGAAQAVFEKVREDVLQIMAGNEAIYVENDPTAQMKQQFAMQIVKANPRYMTQIQNDQRTQMLAEKYMANLQHSYQETVLSKQQGRLGVSPLGMEKGNDLMAMLGVGT